MLGLLLKRKLNLYFLSLYLQSLLEQFSLSVEPLLDHSFEIGLNCKANHTRRDNRSTCCRHNRLERRHFRSSEEYT